MSEYYLAHHGIKGQRWGVRRFQDESGYLTPAGRARYGVGPAEAKARAKADKHIAKIEKSKTRLGKAWHNEMAYMHERDAIEARNKARDKGNLKKELSNMYGAGKKSAEYEAEANYQARRKGYLKNERARKEAEIAEYNNRQMQKRYDRIHNAEGLKKTAEVTLKSYGDTKLKTASGKETTLGKEVVKNVLVNAATGALGNYALLYSGSAKSGNTDGKKEDPFERWNREDDEWFERSDREFADADRRFKEKTGRSR